MSVYTQKLYNRRRGLHSGYIILCRGCKAVVPLEVARIQTSVISLGSGRKEVSTRALVAK